MVVRLKDAVKLSDLASKVYKNLEPGKYVGNLAPSLGLVIQRDLGIASVEISNEFLDPVIFLSFTHFREPVKEALKTINTALQRGGEGIVLSLTHAMGLGKTHF
jgi:predicted AAA+ superfamily ATPase